MVSKQVLFVHLLPLLQKESLSLSLLLEQVVCFIYLFLSRVWGVGVVMV